VALSTTDGFLYPNRVLEERGLMKRKGFPESYDLKRLMGFMADVKAGSPRSQSPSTHTSLTTYSPQRRNTSGSRKC
jgi:pantothenate kinase